jgi:hypothetical protein
MAYAACENDTLQIELPAPAPAADAVLPARAEEPQSDTAVVAERGDNRNRIVAASLISGSRVLESHGRGDSIMLV